MMLVDFKQVSAVEPSGSDAAAAELSMTIHKSSFITCSFAYIQFERYTDSLTESWLCEPWPLDINSECGRIRSKAHGLSQVRLFFKCLVLEISLAQSQFSQR